MSSTGMVSTAPRPLGDEPVCPQRMPPMASVRRVNDGFAQQRCFGVAPARTCEETAASVTSKVVARGRRHGPHAMSKLSSCSSAGADKYRSKCARPWRCCGCGRQANGWSCLGRYGKRDGGLRARGGVRVVACSPRATMIRTRASAQCPMRARARACARTPSLVEQRLQPNTDRLGAQVARERRIG